MAKEKLASEFSEEEKGSIIKEAEKQKKEIEAEKVKKEACAKELNEVLGKHGYSLQTVANIVLAPK